MEKGRLADLLEDLQAPDMGDVLPMLGGEYDIPGRTGDIPSDHRMSQFHLLEESLPSSLYQGSGVNGSGGSVHTMHTLEVLA